ncbi:hypothetical protein [Segatella bryantii]|nr:hypothetical protein [Segatella bryantii]
MDKTKIPNNRERIIKNKSSQRVADGIIEKDKKEKGIRQTNQKIRTTLK